MPTNIWSLSGLYCNALGFCSLSHSSPVTFSHLVLMPQYVFVVHFCFITLAACLWFLLQNSFIETKHVYTIKSSHFQLCNSVGLYYTETTSQSMQPSPLSILEHHPNVPIISHSPLPPKPLSSLRQALIYFLIL